MDDNVHLEGHLGRGWAARYFDGDPAEGAGPPAALHLRAVTSVDADGVEELISLACGAERVGQQLQLRQVPTGIAEDLLRLGLGDILDVRRGGRRLRLVH